MSLSFLKCSLVSGVIGAALFAGQVSAAPVYLRSNTGQPWGVNTNETAMNAAFGAGVWSDLRYETANVATLFSAANRFIFMEGGDTNADELEAFLGANGALIAAWVNGGGSLFVNAAPNEGDGMNYGFGVTLSYPDFDGCDTATAVNAAHPIFSGVATAYTGSSFCHANVFGAGLTSLINDGSGESTLAEMAVGAGHVMFGGMTTTNFQDPEADAFNLRVNILEYGAAQAGQVVPEPNTALLVAAAALAFAGRRRQKTAARASA
ncbi:PEP-CTERM sorting domain-containing protein [Ideonella sp. A 288]|uniref:PEP-CTERM sorting domain-containing protein n=1 Tax=Ideonella sp. A 288 TaxID=1962181 RepID=UPI001303D386|nr:PEP-CTERM sorting domain-containing protein [Ideonella sp. A 288]